MRTRPMNQTPVKTPLRTLLPLLLACATVLVTTGCDTAMRHSEHSLSFPDALLNAQLGPRRVVRTDWDPFGWAGHPADALDPERDTAYAEARPQPAPARVEPPAPPRVATAAVAPVRAETAAPPSAAEAVASPVAPKVAQPPAAPRAAHAQRGPVELDAAPPATAYDPADAAAYVAAVYEVNGVDLRKAARGGERSPTIVELYRHAYRSGIVYQSERPATGDLVFFHNTFDRNGDARWNDWYTLVGVVESVAEDGTVSALAYVDGRVTRLHVDPTRMHEARDENGAPINSALRGGDDVPAPRAGYAGALFAGYANLLGDLPRVTVIDNWKPGMVTASR